MKIELRKIFTGKWCFRIIAKNGVVLAHSRMFARKRNALRSAELLCSGEGFDIVEAV